MKTRAAQQPRSKDGVGPSSVALPAGTWPTIIDFLCAHFPAIPFAEWQARMDRGDVIDASGRALTVDSAYQPHSKIYYYRSLPAEPRIPFDLSLIHI